MQDVDNSTTLSCAIFGGGCFWCLEAIYQSIKGVVAVEPGYAGGKLLYPDYEAVCTGETGHAEVVKLLFADSQIDYRVLLDIFFALHDPTTLNRQGNDIGSQYRSLILATSPLQLERAQSSKSVLAQARMFSEPIVTQIYYLDRQDISHLFWPAESMHSNYYRDNQFRNPYCSVVIQPKLRKIREQFSQYWR
jgi:peptide-methionine (S)-S-oxide reductase